MASKELAAKFILRNVRLSFPKIWEKVKYDESDPKENAKYSADLLIQKRDPQAKALAKAVKELGEKRYNGKKFSKPYKNGDEFEYDGYPGCIALTAKNSREFYRVGRNKQPITEEDNILYSGCYVNASVRLYTMPTNLYGKNIKPIICAELKVLQFVRDGESFERDDSTYLEELPELEGEFEGDDEFEAERPKPKRKSKRKAPTDDFGFDDDGDDEFEEERPKRKPKRKAATTESGFDDDGDDEFEEERPKRKAKRKAATTESGFDDDGDDEFEEERPKPKRKPKRKAPTDDFGFDDDGDDEFEEERPKPKPKRKPKASTTEFGFDDDDDLLY